MRRGLLAVLVLLAGACGSDGDGDEGVEDSSGDDGSELAPDVPEFAEADAEPIVELFEADGALNVCGEETLPGDISGSYEQVEFELREEPCPPADEFDVEWEATVTVELYSNSQAFYSGVNTFSSGFGDTLIAVVVPGAIVEIGQSASPEAIELFDRVVADLDGQAVYDGR